MNYNEMSYRALQAECKENGLDAKGTKADLVERLQADNKRDQESADEYAFVFVGDQDKEVVVSRRNPAGQMYQDTRTMKADNPPWIVIPNDAQPPQEFTFGLNGSPVTVPNVPDNRNMIRRLLNNAHFETVNVIESEAA